MSKHEQTLTVNKWKLLLNAHLDTKLSRADLTCLAYLLERYNKQEGYAFPSFEMTAKDLDLSIRHAKRCAKKLKDRGYLHIKSGNRTRANEYYPNFAAIENWQPEWCKSKTMVTHKSPGGGDTQVTPVVTHESRGVVTYESPQPSLSEPKTYNHYYDREQVANSQEPTQGEAVSEESCRRSEEFNLSGKEEEPRKEKDITDLQREYIDLKIEKTARDGEIKKSKGSLRNSLEEQAKNGTLNTEDLEDLRYEQEVQVKTDIQKEIVATMSEDEARSWIKHLLLNNEDSYTFTINGNKQKIKEFELSWMFSQEWPVISCQVNDDYKKEIQQAEEQKQREQRQRIIQGLFDKGYTSQDICDGLEVWKDKNLNRIHRAMLQDMFPDEMALADKKGSLYHKAKTYMGMIYTRKHVPETIARLRELDEGMADVLQQQLDRLEMPASAPKQPEFFDFSDDPWGPDEPEESKQAAPLT